MVGSPNEQFFKPEYMYLISVEIPILNFIWLLNISRLLFWKQLAKNFLDNNTFD